MFSFCDERSATFLASSSRMAWRRRMVWRADSRLASTRRSRFASFSACVTHAGEDGSRNRERGARVGYLGERVPGPWPVAGRRGGLVVRWVPAGAGAAGARGRLDAHLPQLQAQPRARQLLLVLLVVGRSSRINCYSYESKQSAATATPAGCNKSFT